MVWRSRCGVCALGKFACGSVRAVCGRRGGHSVRRGRRGAHGVGEPERDGPTVNGHSERIDSERIADYFFPKVPWS